MRITYRVISEYEARTQGYPGEYPGQWDYEPLSDWDTCNLLYRCEDDVPVEVLGTDGGEPGDQTLQRGWSWVATALQAAYELGVEHGAGR